VNGRAPDADDRGLPPIGTEDPSPDRRHAELPPADPGFRPGKAFAKIDLMLRELPPRQRTQTFFPYVFVRAVPGDMGGGRPLWEPTVCWESCDIHLIPDVPGPFEFTRTVLNPVGGSTYRVFVHVWNLGRIGAYAGRLRAWWVEPGFFNGTADPRYTPHFIGGTFFDLGDRDSGSAHRLLEVTPAWTVTMNSAAHECLIVAVECATDPWDGSMDANNRRHVAQRNLTLVPAADDLRRALSQLAGMVGPRQQLVLSSATVSKAPLGAAVEAGVAGSRELGGWNHSALVPGTRSTPLATVTSAGKTGRRYSDRTKHERGVAVKGELSKALPTLLQHSLGVADLRAATVAAALTGAADQAALLRLSVSDAHGGGVGGYSLLLPPA
jgi:hypothetical protein